MGEKGELDTRATRMDADMAEKESWPLNSSSRMREKGIIEGFLKESERPNKKFAQALLLFSL